MTRRRFKLRNLEVDRVDLVDKGANQYAEIVIAKGRDEKRESIATNMRDGYPVDTQLKNGPTPTVRIRRKKKKKGSADAERNAAEMGSAGAPVAPPAEKPNPFAKHHGPGAHASGSSQDVHGKGGGGSKKPSNAGSSNKGIPKGKEGGYSRPGGGVPADEGTQESMFEEKLMGEYTVKPEVKSRGLNRADYERAQSRDKRAGEGGIGGGLGPRIPTKEGNKGMPSSDASRANETEMWDSAAANDSGGDAKFENWMNAADMEVSRRAGLSIHDLADMNYRDMYEDGLSPKRAAGRALRNEGFNGGMLKDDNWKTGIGSDDLGTGEPLKHTVSRASAEKNAQALRFISSAKAVGVMSPKEWSHARDMIQSGRNDSMVKEFSNNWMKAHDAASKGRGMGPGKANSTSIRAIIKETYSGGSIMSGYEADMKRLDSTVDMLRGNQDKIKKKIRKAFPPPKPKPGVPVDPRAAAVPGKPVPPKPGVKPGMPQLKDVVGKPGAPGAIPGQPAAPAPPGGVGLGIDPSQTPTPGAPTPGAPVAPGAPAPGPAAAPPMGKPAPTPQLSPNPGVPPLGPGSAPGKRPVATPATVPGKKPPPKAAAPPNPLMDDKKKKLADQMRQKGAPPSGGKPF